MFVLGVIGGVLLHQLLTIIQPIVEKRRRFRRLEFGSGFVIRLSAERYTQVKAYALAALVLFLIGSILLVAAQSVHPPGGYAFTFADVLLSPRLGAIFFGGIVGILLGDLVNRVLHSANYKLMRRDYLAIGLMFVLFILGIGGEELVRSYAQRISKVSFGATNEISFAQLPAGPSERASGQAATAFQSTLKRNESDYLKAGGSAGLSRNANLASTIRRDRDYFRVLFVKHEKIGDPRKVDQLLTAAEEVIRVTVAPVSSCLAAISARTAHAAFVNEKLVEILKAFQGLVSQNPEENFRRAFVVLLRAVGEEAYRVGLKDLLLTGSATKDSEDEVRFIQACTPLVSLLCVDVQSDEVAGVQEARPKETPWVDQSMKWLLDQKERRDPAAANCLINRYDPSLPPTAEAISQHDIRIAQQRDERKNKDFAVLNALVPNGALDQITRVLPYFTMAHAGTLVQLGYYEAAALVLHNWIAQQTSTDFPTTWYVVRARFFLAGYLEEWIRTRDDSIPLSLRQYHITNFAELVAKMKDFETIAELKKNNGSSKLQVGLLGATHTGDDEPCEGLATEKGELFGALIQSYVTPLAGYIDHSLKHRENAKKNALTINAYAQQLNTLSLKCAPPSVRREMRAEILEYYARNQLNLVENTSAFKSADTLRNQIMEAGEVVRLGLELILDARDSERNRKAAGSFLERISSSSVIDRYESLLATQQRLKAKEREVAGN
jgi:hypothetical protein